MGKKSRGLVKQAVGQQGMGQPQGDARVVRTAVVSHNGPIPPAAEFEHYDRALPGAAERILAMAERNAAHRRQRELANDASLARERLFSRVAALIFALAALAIAGWCAWLGLETAAATIGGVTIAGVVSAFIFGHKSQQ